MVYFNNFLTLRRMNETVRVSLFFLAFVSVHMWGTGQAYGREDGIWLEEARITVRFRPDGTKEVRQLLRVSSQGSTFDGRIEHLLFLADSESISNWKIKADQDIGNVSFEKEGQGLATRYWVRFDPIPEDSVSYELSFEVETDEPARCPLAVPLADPRDPHSPVVIEVELPPGQGSTGMSFPNLSSHESLLMGEMGGIPTYVNVPYGERSSRAWWPRNGVDLFVLLLIAVSIAIWMRYRERLAEPGEEEVQ